MIFNWCFIEFQVIYRTRGRCFITYQTPKRELKIRRVAEYFWRTSRFLILWWNTVTSVWYSFSNKLILKKKLRMQKRGVFHQISKHVTVHDFFCLWLLIINEFEKVIYLTRMGRSGWFITSWNLSKFQKKINIKESFQGRDRGKPVYSRQSK